MKAPPAYALMQPPPPPKAPPLEELQSALCETQAELARTNSYLDNVHEQLAVQHAKINTLAEELALQDTKIDWLVRELSAKIETFEDLLVHASAPPEQQGRGVAHRHDIASANDTTIPSAAFSTAAGPPEHTSPRAESCSGFPSDTSQ